MKKTLLSLFLILGFVGVSHSANLGVVRNKTRIEQMPSFPGFATYMSTFMGGNVEVTSQTVIISSVPTILHSMVINYQGGNDARIEVFNANYSTFSGNAETIFYVQGTTGSYQATVFDIYLDSGLAVNVTGGFRPSVTPIFRKR